MTLESNLNQALIRNLLVRFNAWSVYSEDRDSGEHVREKQALQPSFYGMSDRNSRANLLEFQSAILRNSVNVKLK